MLPRSVIYTICTGALISASPVSAEQKPVDFMNCRSGTLSMVMKTPEVSVFALDHKGVHVAYLIDSFNNNTNHCVGTIAINKGQRSGHGFCKNVDPDGDMSLVKWEIQGEAQNWSFIHGTGKWKGITGGGQWKNLAATQSVAEGTYQGCVKITGAYELPE